MEGRRQAPAAPPETNTYLTYLNVRVLYGMGVTFDQLFHLPQVGLLNLLELLLAGTCDTQHGDTRETALPWKPAKWPFATRVFFQGVLPPLADPLLLLNPIETPGEALADGFF